MADENQNKKQNPNQLNIELDAEMAEGTYSNLAIITHSQSEFILDFVRVVPGAPKAKVKSRVILNPIHAKRLLMALQDNVNKFESQHGKIEIGGGQGQAQNDGESISFPMNFGGPATEA